MMDYVYAQAGSYRDRVIYIDKLEHRRLYPFIENAFAVVLPSRIDNFPNACIESMAHGKIVIGTRDTGFEQIIQDGLNGFLSERDNPEILARILDLVLTLPPQQKSAMESKAKERITLLQPRYVVKYHLDFYEKVVDTFKKNSGIRADLGHHFADRLLLVELERINAEHVALVSQYHHAQTQFQEQMNAVYLSRSYRFSKKIATLFARLLPPGSSTRILLSGLYRITRNMLKGLHPVSKNQAT